MFRNIGKSVIGIVAAAGSYHELTKPALVETSLHTEFTENKAPKKAIIIGAGAAGVSLSYQFASRGYKVAMIDALPGVSQGCSAAPAGGMQRGNVALDRSIWTKVTNTFLKGGDELKAFYIDWFAALSDPHFWRWITQFSYHSLIGSEELRTRQQEMLSFTSWAIDENVKLMDAHPERLAAHSGHNSNGALFLGSSDLEWPLEPEVTLTAAEVAALEPCVRQPRPAVQQLTAMSADCERWTQALAAHAVEAHGVEVWHNTRVVGLGCDGDGDAKGSGSRVRRLHTPEGTIEVDEGTVVVVAAGSWTPRILGSAGVYVPVYPMKGYNLVLDLPTPGHAARPEEAQLPQRMVVDSGVYASRLGEQLRFAAVGEFCGWHTAPNPTVEAQLRQKVTDLYPAVAPLLPEARMLCGLRPFTSDGIVMVGAVPDFQNLYVNTGPGYNGWKICVGAAELLVRQIEGEEMPDSFDSQLLSPQGRAVRSPLWCWLSRVRWGM